MKKTSIKRKIMFVVLGIAIISLTIFCVAAFSGLFGIRAQMQSSSVKLGEFATNSSGELLESEALNKLITRAKDQSQIINERLIKIAEKTEYLSEYTTGIYQNSNNLKPVAIPYSTSSNNGTLTMQLQSAGGKDDYPAIREEADLLGNITQAYESNRNNMDTVIALYLGTESGFSILYDPFSDDENQVFDPRVRPWYIGAKETRDTFWTDPYIDAASGNLMITCSHPFYDADGEFMGATGIDVVIEDLNNEVVNIDIGENGFAFVVDSEGILISSKDLKKSEDGTYEKKSAYRANDDRYNEIIKNMTEGKTAVETTTGEDGGAYIAYSPITSTNWSVAMVLPMSEIMAAVAQNSDAIQGMTLETLNFVNSTIRLNIITFSVVFFFAVLAVLFFSGRLSDKITQPIVTLEECLGRIARGELDTVIDLKTGDEIERLGDNVNRMTFELKKYISNLQSVTAEKERIGAELNVATQIQASMLPCIFPAFPDRPEFDIYASMQPAKEVGGDFYDFFLVDENTLAMVMADVSGKGVPAALFMVIAKTLIKNNAQYGKSPKEVFETVNNLLCENNEAGMFVTAFMGYLDIPTGKLSFVNAGHNPPLLRTQPAGSGERRFDWLKTSVGFVLAGMEDMFYKQSEITLQPGDELFLYTDGVTEAVNNEKNLFSDPLLLEKANNYPDLPLKEFTVAIKREIDKFAEGAEQADDITMLALRYKGLEGNK